MPILQWETSLDRFRRQDRERRFGEGLRALKPLEPILRAESEMPILSGPEEPSGIRIPFASSSLSDVPIQRPPMVNQPFREREMEFFPEFFEKGIVPPSLLQNQQANLARVRQALPDTSPEGKYEARLAFATPEQVEEAIAFRNIGPLVDIGKPGSISILQGVPILGAATQGEDPFPVVGNIPGLRTPAELAATVGTLGIGGPLIGPAVTAGGIAGATAGGRIAPELGVPAPVGELVGGLTGGVAAGVVARPAARLVTAGARGAAESIEDARLRARLEPEVGGGIVPERLGQDIDQLMREAKIRDVGTPVKAGIRGFGHFSVSEKVALVMRGSAEDIESLATRFDDAISGISPQRVATVRQQITNATRQSLNARGLPDRFLVFRGGELERGFGLESGTLTGSVPVTLDPYVAAAFRSGDEPLRGFVISKADVVADVEAVRAGKAITRGETELLVRKEALSNPVDLDPDRFFTSVEQRAIAAGKDTLEETFATGGPDVSGAINKALIKFSKPRPPRLRAKDQKMAKWWGMSKKDLRRLEDSLPVGSDDAHEIRWVGFGKLHGDSPPSFVRDIWREQGLNPLDGSPISRGTVRGVIESERGGGELSQSEIAAQNLRGGAKVTRTRVVEGAGQARRFLDDLARNPPEGFGVGASRTGELGGFPKRFVGQARKLEGGPPPPPERPPDVLGGFEEPPIPPAKGIVEGGDGGGEDPLVKVIALIKSAREPRAEAVGALSRERGRRFAGAASILERGGPAEARLRAAKGQLRGEAPEVRFEPIRGEFTDAEYDDLLARALDFDFGAGQTAENIRAGDDFTKILLGGVPTEAEIALLERVYGPEFARAILGKRPFSKRAFENAVDLASLPKTVLTFLDHSFPGRQGLRLAPSNPKDWAKSAMEGAKALARPRVAAQVEEQLLTDSTSILVREGDRTFRIPYSEFKRKTGLFHALLAESAPIAEREEAFISRWARRIPFLGAAIRASERGFVTSGNLIRSDVLKKIVLNINRPGEAVDMNEARGLANLINRATGRGTLEAGPINMNQLAPLINSAQFAIRFRLSGPQWVANLVHPSALVRKEAWRQVMSYYTAGASLLAVIKFSGLADVEVDPRSSNFGKIKIGNQSIDFWTGTQQQVRAVAQAATGLQKAATGDFFPISRGDVAWRYIRSGLSPAASLITDMWSGTTFIGEEARVTKLGDIASQLFDRLVPLAWQDIVESAREEGLKGGLIASSALLGISISAFEPLSLELRRKFQELTGREYNPESAGDRRLVDENEELRGIKQESREKSVRLGSESAIVRKENLEILAQAEIDQAVVRTAESCLAGSEIACANWSKTRSDFLGFKAGVAGVRPVEFDPKTEAGRLADEYFSINPKSPEFTDENGETDWDKFDAAREAVLLQMDPRDAKAIREADKFQNESVNMVDQEFQQARALRNDLDSVSKWQGLTPEQSQMIDDFSREVREETPRIAERLGRRVTQADVARFLAEQQDKPFLAEWFIGLQSDKNRQRLRNPEYDLRLNRGKEKLQKFYPDIFSQATLERLGFIEGEEETGGFQPLEPLEPILAGGGR